MFPKARNSLRHENASRHKKIPVPISVTLHNLLPNTGNNPLSNSSTPWFRAQHDAQLLPKIRLDVIIMGEKETGGATQNTDSERVVYSSSTTVRSVHPSWEHLDERIDLPEEWWLKETDLYRSMKLRFTSLEEGPSKTTESDSHFGDKTDEGTNEATATFFLEVPAYPANLERLTKSSTNNNSESADEDSEAELPTCLPANACFVHFSDGSTRLPTKLFELLLERQMTDPPPLEDFSRFEDDAFRALDGVAFTPERKRKVSVSQLLEVHDHGEEASVEDVEHDAAIETETRKPPPTVSFDKSEQDAKREDSDAERTRLQALISKEDAALQQEMLLLDEERASLSHLLKEAKELERDVGMIQTETSQQQVYLRRDQLLKQAQSIKLIKELRVIYPITLDTQKGYLIRDLRLPVDIYTTSVPEEEISAALGFCCHLIFMISKYLSIPLRHKLHCNSSRSSILQQEGSSRGVVFPLFLAARMVEREQLDRGMALLGGNVDCILMTCQIDYTPRSHILARLKRVYDHILDHQ